METIQPIEYHSTRDFSRKMNATFEFIRQNWKSLAKSLLLIAGPPVLIASLIFGSFMGDMMSLSALQTNPDAAQDMFFSVSFWLQVLLAAILFLLSSVMAISTVNNYIILYGELKTNKIDTSLVWDRVRQTFWMYLGTTFFFFVLMMAIYLVMLIPVGILAVTSPGAIFLAILLLLAVVVYLMVSFSLTFIIRAYEGIGFMAAVGRSLNLVKGKWWSTFGLIFVLYVIMMTISYIPIIPLYFIMMVSVLHTSSVEPGTNPMESMGLVFTVFFTINYMFQILLAALPNVGIAFQYFNLVEMKEARGLMSSIDTFGEPAAPPAPTDETY